MKNKVLIGDALTEMSLLVEKSVDHIICDLPFYRVSSAHWDNQWDSEEEYLFWCEKIILEYKRLLKNNGNLFLFTGRQLNRKVCYLLDKFFQEKRIIIWARKRNFNNSRGKALASGYEPICYYSNGKDSAYNSLKIPSTVNRNRKEYKEGFLKEGVTLSDVWTDIPALPHNSKEKTPHPTQKPLALLERIVLMGTNEGDLILDSCAGSGTTAIACVKHQRNFILIEKEISYGEIIKKRLLEVGIET